MQNYWYASHSTPAPVALQRNHDLHRFNRFSGVRFRALRYGAAQPRGINSGFSWHICSNSCKIHAWQSISIPVPYPPSSARLAFNALFASEAVHHATQQLSKRRRL